MSYQELLKWSRSPQELEHEEVVIEVVLCTAVMVQIGCCVPALLIGCAHDVRTNVVKATRLTINDFLVCVETLSRIPVQC